jgi:hypothetical protein
MKVALEAAVLATRQSNRHFLAILTEKILAVRWRHPVRSISRFWLNIDPTTPSADLLHTYERTTR